MARVMLDVDEEALARAQVALGTTTVSATVNAALRRVASAQERHLALSRELARGDRYATLADRDELWR